MLLLLLLLLLRAVCVLLPRCINTSYHTLAPSPHLKQQLGTVR
jgi:hypothetical protein